MQVRRTSNHITNHHHNHRGAKHLLRWTVVVVSVSLVVWSLFANNNEESKIEQARQILSLKKVEEHSSQVATASTAFAGAYNGPESSASKSRSSDESVGREHRNSEAESNEENEEESVENQSDDDADDNPQQEGGEVYDSEEEDNQPVDSQDEKEQSNDDENRPDPNNNEEDDEYNAEDGGEGGGGEMDQDNTNSYRGSDSGDAAVQE